ncbi:tripartite tricarboxylate transporter substrate binding protein [Hydrogenophaga sp. 2FB]|uniref:Bug family tripartite tricarboxylate transporter substrate binding protein n=1 Tax=Hydrogenophaga sp. 2FB TaxID=2502187 RepID=UPI0010F9911C|nr:tripartite tricarboxylate transporter substrate binding protein [Hydrogenophaga sp. 2FB]
MNLHTRRHLAITALAALTGLSGLLVSLPAAAQDYPSKPIKFLVGFTPGGSADLISRFVAHKMSERLGQPIVVEQRLGATGIIAQDAVAKGAPDGYTMVLLTGGHPTSAAMKKKLPYHPVNDFGMVSTIIEYPMAIGVRPDSPIKSFADLLARAKAEPGKLSMSSAGTGSLHHLLGEWIKIESGTEMIHVPFKGAAPAYTELLGGRIDVFIETMTFLNVNFKNGQVRPLAVSSSQRLKDFPNVPTISEALPGVDPTSWLGLVVSPGTPPAVVDRLNRELRAVLAEPATAERFAQLGGVPAPSTPDEMRSRVQREIDRWTRVVKLRNIERED